MVSTRSARARKCAITSLPDSVLLETLQLLELKDLGSSIVALGISKSPPLALLVDEALVSNMRKFPTDFVAKPEWSYGTQYGYAVANSWSIDITAALHDVRRAAFPFEARCRYFAAQGRKLAEFRDGMNDVAEPLTDALYVHDMSVFEDARHSENCTLLSCADAQDVANPRRVLFLVSLGIRNDFSWGPGHKGRHCIAVDVLLPEADRFECLWLYDFGTTEQDREPHERHTANECGQDWNRGGLDEQARRRINRACGLEESEGADLYELVEMLSFLGGTYGPASGCLGGAFGRFLEARAKYAKFIAHLDAKEAGAGNATERDEEEDEEEYMEDYDEDDRAAMEYDDVTHDVDHEAPGYFDFPASADAKKLNFAQNDYYGGSPEIRKQLHDWLPTIDRSSLGAVVAATQGFGARFTDDYWEQEEKRMHLERLEEEAKEAAEKKKKEEEEKKKGFTSRVAGRVRTWLGGGNA
jgi:hypothetical protein